MLRLGRGCPLSPVCVCMGVRDSCVPWRLEGVGGLWREARGGVNVEGGRVGEQDAFEPS